MYEIQLYHLKATAYFVIAAKPVHVNPVKPYRTSDVIIVRKQDIFRWAAAEMEESGKAIYSHSWVLATDDLEMERYEVMDESMAGESNLSHENIMEIINWLNATINSESNPSSNLSIAA